MAAIARKRLSSSASRARTIGLGIALTTLACASAPPKAAPRALPPPLEIPRLRAAAKEEHASRIRFREGAPPPSGCFGFSRRTGVVACIVGQWSVSGSGERRLVVLTNEDDGTPGLPLGVVRGEAGAVLAPDAQRALDASMIEGDFVALPAPVMVPVDTPRTFGRLLVELRARSLPADAAEGDLVTTIRTDVPFPDVTTHSSLGANDDVPNVLFENTLASVRCEAPTLAVRALGREVVLVERSCSLQGTSEVVVNAWLCNAAEPRCD